jgi:predicted nucleic acid-binding protein
MKPIFADTSYVLAFLGEKDQHHQRAVAWTRALCAPVVTTEYVVIEVGNSLTKVGDRAVFVDFYRALRQGTKLEVIAASTELQDRGAELFGERLDKEWSLTDCISFVIMSERGMHEALSADRDFEEAGFRALLRYEPHAA